MDIDTKGNHRMKGRKKFYLFPVLAVFFFVQLTGFLFGTEARPSSETLTGSAAPAGEWQLLPLPPPWDQPPPPGDGNMKITVNKFDASGGDIEATIQQSQEVCRESNKVEVISFKWTFTAPIARLRPGATVPMTVELRLLRGNPPCSQAEGRTELFLHRTDSNVSPPFMPSNQVWPGFADQFAPGIQRANFYLQPPGAASGPSGFKINDGAPGCADPKLGWFAITISTTATRFGAQQQYAHFFYKYVFVPAGRRLAIQTNSGNYITAVNGGGVGGPGALHTDVTRIQGWEMFTFIEQGCGGKYAIQTANGNFWSAVNGGGVGGADAIHTNATTVGAWELFTLAPLGGDAYAIKTANGRYLTALNGGGKATGDIVHTDATAVNAWERFRLIPVN
jgi:hypothetical protein